MDPLVNVEQYPCGAEHGAIEHDLRSEETSIVSMLDQFREIHILAHLSPHVCRVLLFSGQCQRIISPCSAQFNFLTLT